MGTPKERKIKLHNDSSRTADIKGDVAQMAERLLSSFQ